MRLGPHHSLEVLVSNSKEFIVTQLSELQFDCELDRTWTADLIQRIQPAICATCAKKVCQRLCGAAKQSIRQGISRTAKVWMVEDIEHLCLETQTESFRELKLSMYANISLPGSETAQDIASEITLRATRCRDERCRIKSFATRILPSEKFKRHSWNQVWSSIKSDAVSRER